MPFVTIAKCLIVRDNIDGVLLEPSPCCICVCVCLCVCLSVGYSVSKVGVTKLAMIQAMSLESDHRQGILVNAVSQKCIVIDLCVCVYIHTIYVCISIDALPNHFWC